MPKFAAITDRWLSRASGIYSFWPLVPSGILAVITGYLSSSVAWISQFGAFGWWSVGFLAFMLSGIAFAALGVGRERWISARAAARWNLTVDTVNPMADTFQDQRIRISDIAHPITKRIEGKTFLRFELFGPDNITVSGSNMVGVHFNDCEFVIIKDGGAVKNVKLLDRCTFTNGAIWNCTIFMSQDDFQHMKNSIPGVEAITYERP